MTFRVAHQPHPARHEARIALSSRRRDGRLTGSIGTSITNHFAACQVIRCEVMRMSCCTFSAGGRVFIIPMRSPKVHSPNRPCSTTCDSSPARNARCAAPPSISVLPSSIVPCAPYSRRSRSDRSGISDHLLAACTRWALASRGLQLEPVAGEDAQTNHSASVGGRSGAVLVQFS